MALFGKQLTISGQGVAVFQSAGNGGGGQVTNRGQGTINLDNILKLIPGDVISLYMTGIGLSFGGAALGAQAGAAPVPIAFGLTWPTLCFAICLVACLVLRIVASTPDPFRLSEVNWGLVIVTGLAFFIWAHAVSDRGPVVRGSMVPSLALLPW